ncbi:hypothetical protein [Robertmurraya massiliosenegalensis]|uniref:hypothetical protein n=1 Tax=Robertmurraya massiliosenegalensis TaxID=1287657 RepID=UPI000379A54D|nr:hypothetical protein [Robertmurraya massiliosenegalensis]
MYGQYHEVPYNSNVEEAIIGPFSWSQLLWLAPGIMGTYQVAQIFPKLPLGSLIFDRVHWFIPIIISLVFAFFKDPKTNLSLFQLILTKIKLKARNRTFYYRRKNMPSVNEVESR